VNKCLFTESVSFGTAFDSEKAVVNFLRNVVSSNYQTSFEEKSMNILSDENLLESYRGYLWALAHAQLNRQLRSKLDPSDLVQQTLLKAHSGIGELRDRNPNILVAWLRQILAGVLTDEIRHLHRGKRDVAREQGVVNALNQSAVGMEQWLVADQTSPSMAAQRNEQLLHLANSLLALPVDQREVIILKHLRERTLQQIAEETQRTVPAVAGLLRRGLATLREVMDE
jgi:RNA polymerase sigma-70 factor (ECF subfamily)